MLTQAQTAITVHKSSSNQLSWRQTLMITMCVLHCGIGRLRLSIWKLWPKFKSEGQRDRCWCWLFQRIMELVMTKDTYVPSINLFWKSFIDSTMWNLGCSMASTNLIHTFPSGSALLLSYFYYCLSPLLQSQSVSSPSSSQMLLGLGFWHVCMFFLTIFNINLFWKSSIV